MTNVIAINQKQHIGLKAGGIFLIVLGVVLLAVPLVPSTPFIIGGMFLIGEESVTWVMDRLSEERKERVKQYLHKKEEVIERYLKKLPETLKDRAKRMLNVAKHGR